MPVHKLAALGAAAQRHDAVVGKVPHERDRDTEELRGLLEGVELLAGLLVVADGLGVSGGVGAGDARRPPAVELLLDDREGQEPVLLEVEDGLEPLDVARGVQPVAARCAGRREEPLVLEVADL